MNHVEEIKKEMIIGIQSVLKGKNESYRHELGSLELFINLSEYLGAEHCDEFDRNGWQSDMWDAIEYEGKKFQLTSTGYSGGAKISSDY